VEYDADTGSATYDQYRYNYYIENLADLSRQLWQSLEIFTVNPVIAYATDTGSGDRNVWVQPWGGGSEELSGLPVFGAWIQGPGMAEGQRTDSFWYTSYASPGAGIGAGEGSGVGWVYSNPGSGRLPAPIPEPGTMALLGMGIVGIGFLKKTYRKNSRKI